MVEADNLLNYVLGLLEHDSKFEGRTWTLAIKAISEYLGHYKVIPVNIDAIVSRSNGVKP